MGMICLFSVQVNLISTHPGLTLEHFCNIGNLDYHQIKQLKKGALATAATDLSQGIPSRVVY
jgi:hypothetical protein